MSFGLSGIGGGSTVIAPSGDVSGAFDAASIMAAVSSGARAITLGPGDWHLIPGTVNILKPYPIWIFAYGANFFPVGSAAGPLFTIHDNTPIIPRNYSGGGFLGGTFFINGANGSYAAEVGDIFQYEVNVRVINSAGLLSVGWYWNNRYYWTEESRGYIYTEGCETVYDNSVGSAGTATGSFDRNGIIHNINNSIGGNSPGVCHGVVLQGGAQIADPQGMTVQGNMLSAAAQYAAIFITGSNSQGFSGMSAGTFYAGVECDNTGLTPPMTVMFGSNSNQWFNTLGAMDWGADNPFTATNKNGNFTFFGFIKGDAVLASATNNWPTQFNFNGGIAVGDFNAAQLLNGNGQTISPTGPSFWPVTCATALTGIILAPGPYSGYMLVIANEGAGSVTFAAAGISHVQLGAAVTIGAGQSRLFLWDTNTGTWI